MDKWIGHLIVVSSTAPNIIKFRFTRTAALILLLSFAISFCAVLLIAYTFPPLVTDSERERLVTENGELRIRNLNARLGVIRVSRKVAHIESQTQRLQELALTD